MSFHAAETSLSLHILNAFTFANAAARLAGSGYTLTSADIGKVAIQTDVNRYYILLNHSPISWSEITTPTSALGGVNYAPGTDSTAEDAVGDWVTYNDSASNIPVNGVGGSVSNLTLTRSTSSPLRGQASFLLTASTANVQGEGCSLPITIDSADQAKMLAISFDYSASANIVASDGTIPPLNDGTTSVTAGNSSIEVFVYDITNAQLLMVSPQVIAAKGANNFTFKGSFQTNSNSVTYRLILHCARPETNGWVLKFDNVFVGPQAITAGAPVTDWASYTPTGAWTSDLTYEGFWRRVGDSMEVRVKVLCTGSPGPAGSFTCTIPSGHVIDVAKLQSTPTTAQHLGTAEARRNSSALYYTLNVAYASTTSVFLQMMRIDATDSHELITVSTTTPFTWTTNDILSIRFSVPISGWGSSLQLSNDSDTRVVEAIVHGATTTLTAATDVILNITADTDTHKMVGTNTIIVPVSGVYSLGGIISGDSRSYVAGNALTFSFTINTTSPANLQYLDIRRVYADLTLSMSAAGQRDIYLNAGDVIRFWALSSQTASLVTTVAATSMFVRRQSGPATIAVNETVTAKYATSAGASLTSGVPTTVVYATKSYDTHGGMNTSTGIFTIPVSSKYRVTSRLTLDSVAWVGDGCQVSVNALINGSPSDVIANNYVGKAVTQPFSIGGSCEFALKAGDTLAVQATQNSSNPAIISADASRNYVSITRIGN